MWTYINDDSKLKDNELSLSTENSTQLNRLAPILSTSPSTQIFCSLYDHHSKSKTKESNYSTINSTRLAWLTPEKSNIKKKGTPAQDFHGPVNNHGPWLHFSLSPLKTLPIFGRFEGRCFSHRELRPQRLMAAAKLPPVPTSSEQTAWADVTSLLNNACAGQDALSFLSNYFFYRIWCCFWSYIVMATFASMCIWWWWLVVCVFGLGCVEGCVWEGVGILIVGLWCWPKS